MASNAANKTAIVLGAGQSHVSRWENGRRVPVTVNALNLGDVPASFKFSSMPESVNERQRLTFAGATNNTSTFTITIPGFYQTSGPNKGLAATTAAITWSNDNATLAAAIQSALDVLTPRINPAWVAGTIKVSSATSGTLVNLVFTGAAGARDFALVTVSALTTAGTCVVSSLTEGAATGAGSYVNNIPDGYSADGTNAIVQLTLTSPVGTVAFPITPSTGQGATTVTTAAHTSANSGADFAALLQTAINTAAGASGSCRVSALSATVFIIELLGVWGNQAATFGSVTLGGSGSGAFVTVFAGAQPAPTGIITLAARGNTSLSFGAAVAGPQPLGNISLLGPQFRIEGLTGNVQLELGFAEGSPNLVVLNNP